MAPESASALIATLPGRPREIDVPEPDLEPIEVPDTPAPEPEPAPEKEPEEAPA